MSAAIADLGGFVRPAGPGSERADLLVRGARCAACLNKIETAVAGLPNVQSARLNLTTGRMVVTWRAGRADPAVVIDKLESLGYAAAPFDPEEAQEEQDREGRRLSQRNLKVDPPGS